VGDVGRRDVEGDIFLRMDGELMEEEEEGGLVPARHGLCFLASHLDMGMGTGMWMGPAT